jgi:positive regulator of sigma E activity
VNATAPGGGVVLSLAEDATAVGSTLLMAVFPLVFLALLVLGVGMTAWLARLGTA